MQAADSLLVKVTTDQGLEGWGETFGHVARGLAVGNLFSDLQFRIQNSLTYLSVASRKHNSKHIDNF